MPPDSSPRAKRCAIYSRKSTEHGLQQDFNSLKAQQAVCRAYIDSQKHRGWIEAYRSYEDPAQSAATLERPAMMDLLADIECGLVDVVVVYKLDRLSRSLLDFVKLLDLFDRFGVTFVCITQNFDTADSLGRLVMNVLLTFAQFEREMTSDRIRDKKRAMSERGLWFGGRPPLGYDLVDHKLVVNDTEARIIRQIFEQFCRFRSYRALERECRAGGVFTKSWITSHGIAIDGTPMRAATLSKILNNPVYAGFVRCSGKSHRGVHQPIITEALWTKVSRLLEAKAKERAVAAERDLFDGMIFDCFGRRMKCDRQFRRNRWIAHYRSYQTEWGRSHRVAQLGREAREMERLAIAGLASLMADPVRLRPLLLRVGRSEIEDSAKLGEIGGRRLSALRPEQLRTVVRGIVARIEVAPECLYLVLRLPELDRYLRWDGIGLFAGPVGGGARNTTLLVIPCTKAVRPPRPPAIELGAMPAAQRTPNKRLVQLIAEAREAQRLLESRAGTSLDDLASSMGRERSYFLKLQKLNYLAPDILIGIHEGRQPRGLTRKVLIEANLPLDWALQRAMFGFPELGSPLRSAGN